MFKRRKFIKHLHIAKNKKFLLTERQAAALLKQLSLFQGSFIFGLRAKVRCGIVPCVATLVLMYFMAATFEPGFVGLMDLQDCFLMKPVKHECESLNCFSSCILLS